MICAHRELSGLLSSDGTLDQTAERDFIEAHGGRIHLEKNPMGGTIARFVLPLDAAATH